MTMWILQMMLALLAGAHVPYADTLPATAAAIDRVAHEAPLYDDEDGVARTAAELVALTFAESAFDPRAVGDHGASLGLAQIGVSNLRQLGLAREQLFDPIMNLRAAVRMMRISHRICRVRPKEERLANYASGGPGCSVPEGIVASRRRMRIAEALLLRHPTRWVEIR